MTPLDHAIAARGGDEAAEMAFYSALRAAELFLVLEEEPIGDTVRPLLLQTGDGPVALAFDSAERLAEFLGQPGAFACLAGRQVAAMLVGQGFALGINLGAEQETLVSAQEIDWLAGTTPPEAEMLTQLPEVIHAPGLLTEAALQALDTRLAQYAGPGRGAWLVDAMRGEDLSPLLVIAGVPEQVEAALAVAVAEAMQFAGGARVELAFVATGAEMLDRVRAVALQFDIDRQTGPRRLEGPPKLL